MASLRTMTAEKTVVQTFIGSSIDLLVSPPLKARELKGTVASSRAWLMCPDFVWGAWSCLPQTRGTCLVSLWLLSLDSSRFSPFCLFEKFFLWKSLNFAAELETTLAC